MFRAFISSILIVFSLSGGVVIGQDKTPGPNELIFVEEEPQPVNMKDVSKLIGYPISAHLLGKQGTVIIRALINEKGVIEQHRVITNPYYILTRAVESKLKYLRFTPAIQKGKPVKFWLNVPFRFKFLGEKSAFKPDNSQAISKEFVKISKLYFEAQDKLKAGNKLGAMITFNEAKIHLEKNPLLFGISARIATTYLKKGMEKEANDFVKLSIRQFEKSLPILNNPNKTKTDSWYFYTNRDWAYYAYGQEFTVTHVELKKNLQVARNFFVK